MTNNVKEWTDQFNPFNSAKLFAQVPRWSEIKKDQMLPPPTLVTIDPTNVCNLDCKWCNSEYIRSRNKREISPKMLDNIADFLPHWNEHPFWKVESVCVAGGGEPLAHKYTGKLVERLANKSRLKELGMVTNGTLIDKHLDYLTNCTWVGVSVDVGTPKTYEQLKGRDYFKKVISNIEKLNSIKDGTPLGGIGKGPGVYYKFLMHPGNVKEVSKAAKIAKEIGCKGIHIRPFGISWDKLKKKNQDGFGYSDILEFRDQLEKAREFEDDNFKVYGITHKFDGDLRKSNQFNNCYAVFMTAVIEPPTEKGFNFGLCCDRRGDKNLTLEDLTNTSKIRDFWGSKDHWKMAKEINVKNCPRCTYQPHNQIYENSISVNNMTISSI